MLTAHASTGLENTDHRDEKKASSSPKKFILVNHDQGPRWLAPWSTRERHAQHPRPLFEQSFETTRRNRSPRRKPAGAVVPSASKNCSNNGSSACNQHRQKANSENQTVAKLLRLLDTIQTAGSKTLFSSPGPQQIFVWFSSLEAEVQVKAQNALHTQLRSYQAAKKQCFRDDGGFNTWPGHSG